MSLHSPKLSRRFAFPAALLAFGLSLSGAYAEDLDTVTQPVAYGDLDLTQPSDAKIFASRLEDAARAVCLKANPDSSPAMLQSCADDAIAVAMAQMQNRMDDEVASRLEVIRTSLASP